MGPKEDTIQPLNPLNKLSHERDKRNNWFLGSPTEKPEGKNPKYNIQGMKVMEMSNQYYDVSKWVILVFLPALAVLVAGIGELYGLVNTPAVSPQLT